MKADANADKMRFIVSLLMEYYDKDFFIEETTTYKKLTPGEVRL